MKKVLLLIVMCAGLSLVVAGCISTKDPVTGQTQTSLDPNTVGQVERAAETAIGILGLLGIVWPFLLPVATAGGAVYGTWKTVKPKLVTAQTQSQMYYSATASIVQGIEAYKAANREQWDNLEGYLAETIGPKAENIIRALRKLPAKE